MIELITGPLYMCIQSPVGPKGKLWLGTRVWPYSVLLVFIIIFHFFPHSIFHFLRCDLFSKTGLRFRSFRSLCSFKNAKCSFVLKRTSFRPKCSLFCLDQGLVGLITDQILSQWKERRLYVDRQSRIVYLLRDICSQSCNSSCIAKLSSSRQLKFRLTEIAL